MSHFDPGDIASRRRIPAGPGSAIPTSAMVTRLQMFIDEMRYEPTPRIVDDEFHGSGDT